MNEHAENDQDMDRADEILVNKTGLFGLYPGDDIDDILALKKQSGSFWIRFWEGIPFPKKQAAFRWMQFQPFSLLCMYEIRIFQGRFSIRGTAGEATPWRKFTEQAIAVAYNKSYWDSIN